MKTYSIKDIPNFIPRQIPIKKVNERLVFAKSRKIVHLVCCEVGMTYNELTEKNKSKGDISLNKHIASYLAIKETGISWSAMGRILNDDHSAIIYGFDKIEFNYPRDIELSQKINTIRDRIKMAI